MRVKQLFLHLLFSMITMSIGAQSNDRINKPHEYSLKMIAGQSEFLTIIRDYAIFQDDKGEMTSNSSPLFAFRFNYSRAFTMKSDFMWDIGFEAGLDSYNVRLRVSSQFIDRGTNRIYDNYGTEYDLFYSAAILGIRYDLPLSERSSLSFKMGSRFTFFRPMSIKVTFAELTASMERIDLFVMNMEVNPDNKIIISPDLTIGYHYSIPNSRLSIYSGLNASLSQKTSLTGNYQILGDQETLAGSVSKRAMFIALNLGVSYDLQ